MVSSKPSSHVLASGTEAAPLLPFLLGCSHDQLIAAVNLLYRIMDGNGVLNRLETIGIGTNTLKARHTSVVFEVTDQEAPCILSLRSPLANTSPAELMSAGAFMGALRVLGGCEQVENGVCGTGTEPEHMILGFESRKHLVKAMLELAKHFPKVELLGGGDKPRTALELISQIAHHAERQA